jgi:NAD-dependent deacetylase
MHKPHLVVLSGAGISAESGLKTFRDSEDGLWNGYDIEDVATPLAWKRNKKLVLDFYNYRRREVLNASPNAAHCLLATLETDYNVTIVTQNIDDLHERAGSKRVIHLHGEIVKKCSEYSKAETWPCKEDILPGELAPDGGQMRPFIVWFGEPVYLMEDAFQIASEADIFAVIGTSLQVYPAAGLIHAVPRLAMRFVVDRSIPLKDDLHGFTKIELPATIGVASMVEMLSQGI